jgi:flagellar motor switch protein FliM
MAEKASSAETVPAAPAACDYQVLNPRTVGRPVHLATKFAGQIRADLVDRFLAPLNTRYHANFSISNVTLVHSTTRVEPQKRWLAYPTDQGHIWIALSRPLLLCILRYRYGSYPDKASADKVMAPPADAPAPPKDSILEPESATEDRLSAMLGAQLLAIVTRRILTPADGAAAPAAKKSPSVAEICTSVPIDETWTLRVQIDESARALSGTCWVVLDESWMARILTGPAVAGESAAPRKGGTMLPLAGRLQLTLVARLLEKDVPLGTVMDWSVGDVMPITLGPTDVLIGGSRLFTASVAETGAKICLTAFKDVE